MLGSTTGVLGKEVVGEGGVSGYEEWKLPEWVEEGNEPDASLREGGETGLMGAGTDGESKGKVSASRLLEERAREQGLEGVVNSKRGKEAKAGGKDKSLDDWLEESEGEDESGDETEEETETEGEEEDEDVDTSGEEASEDDDGDQGRGLMS